VGDDNGVQGHVDPRQERQALVLLARNAQAAVQQNIAAGGLQQVGIGAYLSGPAERCEGEFHLPVVFLLM